MEFFKDQAPVKRADDSDDYAIAVADDRDYDKYRKKLDNYDQAAQLELEDTDIAAPVEEKIISEETFAL